MLKDCGVGLVVANPCGRWSLDLILLKLRLKANPRSEAVPKPAEYKLAALNGLASGGRPGRLGDDGGESPIKWALIGFCAPKRHFVLPD